MLRALRVGAIALPILLVSAYPFPDHQAPPAMAAAKCAARQEVGQVSAVQEGVSVRHAKRWKTAKKGTKIYAGDTLQTRKGQRAAVTVCGGGKVYVNQETVAVMRSRQEAQAKRGEVAERSSKKATQVVRTREAVVRSRGSYLDVKAQKTRSVVTAASGDVQVQNKFGHVHLTADRQTAVRADRKPTPPKQVDSQRALAWAAPLGETWKILTADGVLSQPYRVALDSQGNMFVTDDPSSGRRVVKLSPSGQVLTQWKLQGTVTEPIGIAVDAQNNVYVADNIGNNVQKFTDNGQLEATYDLEQFPSQTVISPTGIDLDAAGNMYVVGEFLQGIEKLSPSGKLLAFWGGTKGTGPLQFNDPQDLAVDPQGNIYVADYFNDRIQKLSPSGQFVLSWNVATNEAPTDVALDKAGHVYVSMSTAVNEYDSTGHQLRAWKNDPVHYTLRDPGQFDRAYGVTLDAKDNLYVADHYNNRIQKLIRNP